MSDLGLWISTAATVVVMFVVYLILNRLGARFSRRAGEKNPDSAARVTTLWVMVRRVIIVILFILTVLIILNSIWGFSLAPFLAVGTVLAAAIGFGAQDVVKDLLAGFFILAEDQYQIGDTVTIAGTSGTVQDIQFRVTVLRDLEGNVHFVPNGQIVVTSNFTNVYAQPVLDVGIAYSSDVDRAMEVMLDELKSLAADPDWSGRCLEEPEMLGVQELASSAVIIRARMTTTPDDRWAVKREALRRIKKRFDTEGIEIPFPHLTIFQGEGAGTTTRSESGDQST
jgi:moderate conductance mechanosensitive channel